MPCTQELVNSEAEDQEAAFCQPSWLTGLCFLFFFITVHKLQAALRASGHPPAGMLEAKHHGLRPLRPLPASAAAWQSALNPSVPALPEACNVARGHVTCIVHMAGLNLTGDLQCRQVLIVGGASCPPSSERLRLACSVRTSSVAGAVRHLCNIEVRRRAAEFCTMGCSQRLACFSA